MMMPEAWCSAPARPGKREVRQLGKRDIHAKRARAAAPSLMRRRNSSGRTRGIDELEVEELRIDLRGDGCGADALALVGLDADGTAVLDKHLADRRRKPDVDAVSDGGFRHGPGDGAHAADGVAPDAFLAVHLAEAVVQKNIGRAWRVGARIIADDAVEAVRALIGSLSNQPSRKSPADVAKSSRSSRCRSRSRARILLPIRRPDQLRRSRR